MNRECRRCRAVQGPHANFCSVCGTSLAMPRPVSTVKTGRIALAVIGATLITFSVFAVALPNRVTVTRSFALPHSKADAMFELLRPKDVKVIVARTEDGVRISGTPEEIGIVEGFVNLLTRFESYFEDETKEAMALSQKQWSSRKRYKLSTVKAKALFAALAPDDIPVLVHRSGKYVRVDATQQDQQIVRGMITILRGLRP